MYISWQDRTSLCERDVQGGRYLAPCDVFGADGSALRLAADLGRLVFQPVLHHFDHNLLAEDVNE